jgi:hypothetical protein
VSDQLEIIAPSGAVHIHTLDAGRGVTNIGRHPANDLVLQDSGVADFAATIDHQRKPYVLMTLADNAGVRIDGVPLAGFQHQEINPRSNIVIGSHALVLLEGVDEPAQSPASPVAQPLAPLAATVPAVTAAPTTMPIAPVIPLAGPAVQPTLGPPIHTELDEVIVTELTDRVQTVEVEQTAMWQLTIINGSSLVSQFEVRIEGWVDESWVNIEPAVVNLNEGERAVVTITITPPRFSTTLAGAHHVAFAVRSPTHPDRRARQAATLVVNPFYAFGVDALEPARQTLPYRKRFADFALPIHNQGNSSVTYRIEGSDGESACRFEFLAPPQTFLGTREVRLGPGEESAVPVRVTPLRRRIIGAGAHTYTLRMVATPVEGVIMALPVQGELRHRPLFGRWILLVVALLIVASLIAILSPRINSVSYTYKEAISGQIQTSLSAVDQAEGAGGYMDVMRSFLPFGLGRSETVKPLGEVTVRAGEPVTVTWRTSNGQILYLRSQNGQGSDRIVQEPAVVRSGSLGIMPPPNLDGEGRLLGPTNYILRIENWMMRLPLISSLGTVERPISVNVIPANVPIIRSFTVSTDTMVAGNPVVVSWDVDRPNASDTLALEQVQDGQVVETIPLPEAKGTLVFQPQNAVQYRLISNTSLWTGDAPKPTAVTGVQVQTPTPTPVPSPAIRLFLVEPLQVVAGQSISVSYSISGSDRSVLRLPGLDPSEAPLEFPQGRIVAAVPTAGEFTVILDTVRLPGGSTDPTDPNAARARAVSTVVAVAPTPTQTPTPTLTPTLTPQPPNIQVLELSPKELVRGESTEATLTWTIIGDADEILISAPEFTISSTRKQDTISVPTDKSRVFVMTVVLDGKPAASKSVELKVNEPPTATPTSPPPPTATPEPPTATPIPLPLINKFEIVSKLAGFPVERSVVQGLDVYTVDAGVPVDVVWESTNATSAELLQIPESGGASIPYEKRLPSDLISIVALEASRFELTAINNPLNDQNLSKSSRTIKLELKQKAPPDSPSNVVYSGGLTASQPVTITWQYNPAQTQDISGFRIYRAPANSSDFLPIANETVLNNQARSFIDTQTPTCGKAYYIVAVYLDLTQPGVDKTVETNSGATSYLTPPCPP